MDVGDGAALSRCIAAVVSEYGGLNGVVHAAGVLRDSFVLKKTPEELDAVLLPKVSGVLNLERAVSGLPLESFVVFSSISGQLGNVGQSDYALANAYLDGYAQDRQARVDRGEASGRTLSVSWPLWRSGGMQAPSSTQDWMAREGLESLESEAGMAALYAAWRSGESHVAVLVGREVRTVVASDVVRVPESVAVVDAVADAAVDAGMVDAQWLREQALRYVTRRVAGTLKLSPERMSAEDGLERYGIDSILALKLVDEFETVFGPLPKTLLFEYQTIAALTGYFLDRHRDALLVELRPVSGAAVPVPSPVQSPVQSPARPVAARRPARLGEVRSARVGASRRGRIAPGVARRARSRRSRSWATAVATRRRGRWRRTGGTSARARTA